MNKTIGIYAGSFKPFTIGHLDIVKQSKKIFDHVIVAQGKNIKKINIQHYNLPVKTLNDMGVESAVFDGLLVDFINTVKFRGLNVVLIRGLRSGVDLEYEQNYSTFLRNMDPEINIVALYSKPEFRHISSSALRDIQQYSIAEYNKYVVK